MPAARRAHARRRRAGTWGLAVAAAGLVVCGPLAEASSALPRSVVVDVPITPTPTSEPDGSGLGEAVPGEPVDPTTPPVPDSTEAPGDLDSGEPGAPGESAEPGAPDQTPESPVSEEPVDPTPGSDDATPEETEDPAAPEAPVLDPIPPAASDTSRSAASWIIAIAVLAMSGLLLVALRRRALHASPEQVPDAAYGWPPDAPHAPSAAVTFTAIEAVGEAMLDATYSVITIEAALEDIARANAYPATEVVVLPTALFVSTRGGGELHTGAISSGRHKLLLHQVDALDHLVRAARAGEVDPARILQRVGEIRTAPPPFSRLVRIAAYALLCAGIAVILGASLVGIAVAGVLGGFVGTARLLSAEVSRQREPLVTVALAFGVSTAVFLLARAGWDPGVLPSLIAPLVILLPGALLTTGIIELSAGQMMSGAGRLMAGFMQLTLLSVGIVAGAALVGVPQIVLSEAHHPIGPAGPWIAVAAFGVGVVVHQGGRRNSIPWILLVLYVAYGAQVIGDIFFGGVLSALIGAFVMTPVAVLVSRHPSGPAAAVSFLPAFWLLVPGALGLVGVTALLGGDGDGMSTVVTTLSTMVAIALGILAGSALSSSSRSPRGDVL